MNPAALTAAELSSLLKKAAGHSSGNCTFNEELINQHIAAGAPQNSDDTIHLIHYTAWLAGQVP